eukprot:Nk52_evm14s2640 gene=Nk52_evmTU14s2640
MLPTPGGGRGGNHRYGGGMGGGGGSGIYSSKQYRYLKRLCCVQWRQMDFEMAAWQMLYLCIAPKKVYRSLYYHKQTKNQWARDDPAFLVLLAGWLLVSSIGYCIYFGATFSKFVTFFLWVVLVDCIAVGLLVGTLCWALANKYLISKSVHSVEQKVELQYAFDVHCNSFFPLLLILHVLQLILMPIVSKDYFISTFLGNTLYLVAIGYYNYITFLGYSALPFLEKTVIFLYPILLFFAVYLVSTLIGWNICLSIVRFYGFGYAVGH